MSYSLDFAGLLPYLPEFIKGLKMTVTLTVISTFLGLVLGTYCAIGRMAKSKLIQGICAIYIEVVRNTPFIIQLFFIFFGLPILGLKFTAWQAGLIALVLNLGAYSAEIIRAGIDATPKGQWEAGKTLGFSRWQVYHYIILPPAYLRIYPALVSQCIIVMLGSAVVSQISVEELTFAANFVQSRSFLSFESYMLTALVYLLLAISMRKVFMLLKRVLFKSSVA
ncbi:amino acid ABC transporter permease [Marinomonas sp.]